jgi:hypothetical protein
MTTLTKQSSKLVRTANYVKAAPKQEVSGHTGLDKAIRKAYIPFVFGEPKTLSPSELLRAYSTPTHRIAEMAVAQMFGVEPENAYNAFFDVDTRGLLWDGVDYGRIEVRTRALRKMVSNGRTYYRIDPLSEKDSRTKKGKCDWVFVCCYDHFEDELVWFRIPHNVAFMTKSLVISKNVVGYGWADKYLWVGPDNDH